MFANFNNCDSSSGSVFVRVHVNIDIDADYLQSNNKTSSNDLSILLPASFLFLKVWFNKSGNIKLRIFVFFIVSLLPFLFKHMQTPDYQEAIRSSRRYEFFTSDFIDTFEDNQSIMTQLTIDHFSISEFKYRNFNSFPQLLLSLSSSISLNPGPVYQDTLQCSNKWNVFNNQDLHFIHLNINSPLSKIEKLRYIARSTNAVVIGICESKLQTLQK